VSTYVRRPTRATGVDRHTRLVSGPTTAEPTDGRSLPPVAVAVAVLVATLAGFVTDHLSPPDNARTPGALAAVLAVVAIAGAAATLRWPVPGFVLVAAGLGGYVGRGYPNGPIYLAGLAAMFVLGRRSSRVVALSGLATIEVALVVGWLFARHNGSLVAFYPGWAAAAGAVGVALRSWKFGRAEQTQRRLAEERLRIARDLHDGVAHAMATINVQAAAAAHVIDRQPAAAKQALAAIAQASGTVLDELNAMLRVLRAAGEVAERAPAPGLDDLDALLEPVRVAGRTARLEVHGDLAAVPSTVATAAYRIVQESVTNLLKHSSARTATVAVTATDGVVRVAVTDDGGPVPPPPLGNGLRGMHERATATGGTLTAGPADAGFAVRVEWRLP